ncbi:unnamed protein product [Arabidopsis halleri]
MLKPCHLSYFLLFFVFFISQMSFSCPQDQIQSLLEFKNLLTQNINNQSTTIIRDMEAKLRLLQVATRQMQHSFPYQRSDRPKSALSYPLWLSEFKHSETDSADSWRWVCELDQFYLS